MKTTIVTLLAIMNFAAVALAKDVAPQAEMEQLAQRLAFGAKRADSTNPVRTESGYRDGLHGFYQCFERGCVYYTTRTGVQPVSGVIFERWVAEGYERGPLGFPVGGPRICTSTPGQPRRTFQDFEGGSIIAGGRDARATTVTRGRRVGEIGNCDVVTTGPVTTDRPGASARVRITINGLACHQPTHDDALQRDGVDDEVAIETFAALVHITEGMIGQPGRGTPTMGDTNGFATRIRAGSGSSVAGGNGGFKLGDTFPAGGRPWIRTTDPTTDRIPLLVWEGTLIDDVNAAVILPSLWEDDNRPMLRTPFLDAWNAAPIETLARRTITSGDPFRVVSDLRAAFDSVRMTKDAAGPGDRPVGMIDRGSYYAAQPSLLIFTYDHALRLANAANNGLPRGVFPLEFRDAQQLQGLYTLYFQVEIVP
jgi:hypothetical protein